MQKIPFWVISYVKGYNARFKGEKRLVKIRPGVEFEGKRRWLASIRYDHSPLEKAKEVYLIPDYVQPAGLPTMEPFSVEG